MLDSGTHNIEMKPCSFFFVLTFSQPACLLQQLFYINVKAF